MEDKALGISMADGVDRGVERIPGSRLSGEREAQHLAGERRTVLGEIAARGVPGRHVEQAVGPDREPGPVVDTAPRDIREQHGGRA